MVKQGIMSWETRQWRSIQHHSHRLSWVGVKMHSESVKAYVFLILSPHSLARSPIIGKDGKALDAQSIWCTLFEQLVKFYSSISDEICK